MHDPFLDPGPMIDRELELVPPSHRWLEDMVRCMLDDPSNEPDNVRSRVIDFLRLAPHGLEHGDPWIGRPAAYHFWMHLRPQFNPPMPIAGAVSLRLGDDLNLTHYLGHVGYGVAPSARGHHYAERSVRLLLPLARRHGMKELWITCNPDNLASRRTCERLGCRLVEIVPLPVTHPLYERGERHKCRYWLPL